jgi:hypothetical protein
MSNNPTHPPTHARTHAHTHAHTHTHARARTHPPTSPTQGEPVKLGDGKITVILFWAKFAKGDYTTYAGITDLATRWVGNDKVQFLGVSLLGSRDIT